MMNVNLLSHSHKYYGSSINNRINNKTVKNNDTCFTGNHTPTPIKKDEWNRLPNYNFFVPFQNPYVTMTAKTDVSKLFDLKKEKGIKPSHAIIYLLGKTINDIPEFRVRELKDGQIVQYDKVDPVFSIARDKGMPVAVDYVEYTDNPKEYLKKVSEKINHVKEGGTPTKEDLMGSKDNFFVSCNPWVDYTSMVQADLDNKDAKPLIAWGKYTPEGDKMKMAVSIRIHHGFADGEHIGKFFEKLQENINNVDKIFKDI